VKLNKRTSSEVWKTTSWKCWLFDIKKLSLFPRISRTSSQISR